MDNKQSCLNQSSTIWIALLCILCIACEGETVEFTPGMVNPPEGSASDPSGGDEEDGGDTAGNQDMGGDEPPPPPPPVDMGPPPGGNEPVEVCTTEPDLELFANSIGPRIITTCGNSGCHAFNSNVSPLNFPRSVLEGVDDSLTEEQSDEMIELLLTSRPSPPPYLTWGESEESHLYVYGTPEDHFGGYRYADELKDWIDGALSCELVYPDPPMVEDMSPPPGGMGGVEMPPPPVEQPEPTEIFCDALPSGDPQGRVGFYETFEDEINGILTRTCIGNGCHEQPYPDYSFWVVDEDQPCSVQANFMMAQLYVNFNEPLNSPLLVYPIDPDHGGGGRIFPNGNSDLLYTAIRRWIVSGQQD